MNTCAPIWSPRLSMALAMRGSGPAGARRRPAVIRFRAAGAVRAPAPWPARSGVQVCWDNAAAESFWATLKVEFTTAICGQPRGAWLAIGDWIEQVYNRADATQPSV